MVNMTVSVSRNFYLTVSADRKAMEGEDISVIFEIDENIQANSIRVDMKNGRAVDQRFLLNDDRQMFIKGEFTNRGFLWLQVVFSLETGLLRKTNTYALHIFNSVVGVTPWELVQQELEMLAFVEVRKDVETKDIVFYSLTSDEVGRINISDWLNTTDLENAVEDLQSLTEEHTELIAALQQALDEEAINRENADIDLRNRIDAEIQARTEADAALDEKIEADIENLATNYYTKTDIDELFEDQQSRVIYKDVVATFADLQTAYPTPETGWTAIVLDTNIQYRYNGDTSTWEQISYRSVDIDGNYTGLMTPEMLQQQETNTSDIAEIQQFIDDLVLPDGIRKFYLVMQDDGTRALIPTWDYRGELPNPEQPQEDETIIMVIDPAVIQYWKDQDIISEDVPAITYYGLGTVNTAGTTVYCLCISESGRQLYMVMPVQPPSPTTYYFLNMNDVAYQEDIENLQNQINDLVTRADAIEAKNTEQDGRLGTLEDRADANDIKNTEQDDRLTNAESINTEQDDRLTSLEERVDDSETAAEELTERVSDLEDRADANDTKNADQDARLTAVETKNADQDTRLDGIDQSIVDINNETTSIRGEVSRLDGRIDNTNERIDLTNVAVNQNATNIQTNATNIQTLFNTTERHTDQIQQLQNDVANNNEVITNAVEELAERVTDNEEKLVEHDGVLAGLQTQIDDNKAEFAGSLSDLQDELNDTNAAVSQNTSDIVTIKTDIADINTNIDGVKDSVDDLAQIVTANKAAADAEFETINDTLDDHEQRITLNTNEVSDLRADYEANKEATDDTITDVDNKVDALTNRVSATESKNAQQDTRLDDQASTIASNTSAIGSLQGRMTTAENNITDLTGRVSASEGSITALQTEVGELSTTVEEGLQEANDALEAHKVSGDHDDRYYTQNQVDSKIDAISVGLEVQDPVATFDDLATTYPDAESGWAAYVQDSGITYVFNGTEWKQFTGSSPIVSDTNDGIMTSTMLQQLNTNTTDIADLQTEIADFVTEADVDEKLSDYTRHFELTPTTGSEVSIGSLGLNENETATISMNAVQAAAIGLRSSAQGGILSRGNSTTITLTTYVPGTTQTIVTYAGYDGTNMAPSWINETPLLDILTKNNWADTIDLDGYATTDDLDAAQAELQSSITDIETEVESLSDTVLEHAATLERKVDFAAQADETQQPIFDDDIFVKQIVANAAVTSAWFGSAQPQSIGSYTKSPYGSIYGTAVTVTGKLLFMQWNDTDVEAVLKYEVDLSNPGSGSGDLPYLPYAYGLNQTTGYGASIKKVSDTQVEIMVQYAALRFNTVDKNMQNTILNDGVNATYQVVPTQTVQYYYAYSTDGYQTWTMGTATNAGAIKAVNGYITAMLRLSEDRKFVELSTMGYGTYTAAWDTSGDGVYMPMAQYGLEQQGAQAVFTLMPATAMTYQIEISKSAQDIIKTYDGKTLTGAELTATVSLPKTTTATTYVYAVPDNDNIITSLSTTTDLDQVVDDSGYIIAIAYIKSGRAAVKFMNNPEIISPYAGTRYEEIEFIDSALDTLITVDADAETVTMAAGIYTMRKDDGTIVEATLDDPEILQWTEGALICYDEEAATFVRYATISDYDNVVSTWALGRMVTHNDNKLLAINGWGLYPTITTGGGGGVAYAPLAVVTSSTNNIIQFTNTTQGAIGVRAELGNMNFYTLDGEASGRILSSVTSITVSSYQMYFLYIYKNATGIWTASQTAAITTIINNHGYIWGIVRRYPEGGQISLTTYGLGTYLAPMTSDTRREAYFKAVDETQSPIYWGDSTSGSGRSIFIRPGEYQLTTNDRAFSEIPVTLEEQEFRFEHNAVIVYNTIAETFETFSSGVFDQSLYNKYIIGTFHYVGSNRAVYIEKFGNYIDTPVAQGGGTANVIGLPAVFDVADWTPTTGFTLPAGTYQFVGTTDAKRYIVRLPAASTLYYEFSSVLYFQESDMTAIKVADTGSIPFDAIIVGSMNNIGVATVALNGIGIFPAST